MTNFGPDETVNEKQLDERLRGIADRTGAPVESVLRVAGSAFSAQGGLNNAETLKAVDQAFRLLPGNEESARGLAAGAMDISNEAGTTDFKSILGFISQGKLATSIVDDKQFADSFIPAINAAVTRGGTHEQAGEVFVTLGDLMSDKHGDRTRTAMIGLNEQLATALPKLGGIAERIAYMQQHPQERAAFLDKGHFEIAAAPHRGLEHACASAFACLPVLEPGDGRGSSLGFGGSSCLRPMSGCQDDPGRVAALHERIAAFRAELARGGIETSSSTAIQPVVAGTPEPAVTIADRLRDRGFLVPAIRPPTVPGGTSRLRASLSAGHETGQVIACARVIAEEFARDRGH